MERESAWKRYDEDQLAELEQLAAGYIDFISENKTEREFSAAAIRSAEAAGYESLDAAISAGRKLAPGDRCGQPCATRPSSWCSWAPAR